MRILSVFALLALVAGPVWSEERPRTITVTGMGEVTAAPDMATVTLGVEVGAKTAQDAMAAVNTGTNAIFSVLTAAGIEARDMQTSGLSLNPVWSDYSPVNRTRRIEAFSASNMVTVRVRDLEGLGPVLDAVLAQGANSFRGLIFGMQNPNPLMDEARKDAVQNARHKAELLAEAAGVTLGQVMTISEHGGQRSQPVMMMEAARMSADMAIAEGEVGLNASVSIVYELSE